MKLQSAGILLYRKRGDGIEVFIAHHGGPYHAKKDDGDWSIPKGLLDQGESAIEAAFREFKEEVGQDIPRDDGIELTPVHRHDGKTIFAWAVEGEADPDKVVSNTTEIEWPPRSGKKITIPEVDRAEWFTPEGARRKLHPAQVPFVDELLARLGLENKEKE
jgi:predicted NUDIX family NTP pyrophosphohydrolase